MHVAVFVICRKRQRDLTAHDLETAARARAFEVEMFSGIQALKAMGMEDQAVQQWSALYVDVMNVSLTRGRLSAVVESMAAALRMGSPLVILMVGASLVLDGSLGLGRMLALNALAIGFLTPITNLVASAFQLQLVGAYLDRVNDVLSCAPEQEAGPKATSPKLTGCVQTDGVFFRFGPHSPWVLRDISLSIESGQFVAIVGRSGAGKSTLANILLGLYLPTQGIVRFDGIDLRQQDLQHVRRQIGVVLQNPSLFRGTVRSNIAYSDPTIAFEAVVLAAKRAQIHEDIQAMPMRYDTFVSEMGSNLSGGQRQRLAIARALLHEPSMVLLDEATNALDSTTERALQEALTTLRCTRIVIAHRLSTIRAADLILVVHDGQVVDRGTHEALLQGGGRYASLVAAAASGEGSTP